MQYYMQALKKYAVFNGRATRTEYWHFVLYNFIITIVLSVLGGMIAKQLMFLGNIYSLAVLIPGLAVSVRRLHDIGKSGWMLLVSLIPFIGIIWLIILMATDSQPEENQYGPSPKSNK